jgi:hypothetical protein
MPSLGFPKENKKSPISLTSTIVYMKKEKSYPRPLSQPKKN